MKRLSILLAILMLLPLGAIGQDRSIDWFGNVYTKWLDGDRQTATGLYNNSEFGGGDQGQGTEFELYFKARVSKQVEIGGRLKARFDRNYWTNGGGFADEENEPKSAQYMKFRGVYVRLTPGYSWIDSATIGSNDWGMFDPFTIGKIRYIDRDNVSGLLFQGSNASKSLRYDLARVSLPKLWAGPGWSTGDLTQSDAAYALQLKYSLSDTFNLGLISEYIHDSEINFADEDTRDGVDTTQRVKNFVGGLKLNGSIGDKVDVALSAYYSDFNNYAEGQYNRWSPTLSYDAEDFAGKLNIDINDIADVLTIKFQLFDIGADYQSVMAARREADVLLTEGHDGTWGWSRPDYNQGSLSDNNARNGVGYGGWNGNADQVVSVMADNDFTDFDETMAESVIGWKGFTVAPELTLGELTLAAEYSLIDYNTNWQNSDGNVVPGADPSSIQSVYPLVDGVHGWGLGGDWRSPYSHWQEKETTIMLIKGEYIADVGQGLNLKFKYKMIDDTDDRVETAGDLGDAYRNSTVDHIAYDNREADYTSIEFSAGYQLTDDLFIEGFLAQYEVDLIDGSIDVTPPHMEGWEPQYGWIEYLTGQHKKNQIGIELKYFLSGMEFGLRTDFLDGTYDPEFYEGVNGQLVRLNPTGDTQATAIGDISTDEVDLSQYRLKAFMKVQF